MLIFETTNNIIKKLSQINHSAEFDIDIDTF